MLRLQKARNRDISVNLRCKECRINGLFIKAFAAAVALHLLAAGIFQIHHWINRGDMVLPPIRVETDLSGFEEQDGSLVAYAEGEGRSARHLLAPQPSPPHLPNLPESTIDRRMEYFKENSFMATSFLAIEENADDLAPIEKKDADVSSPLIIRVSGELSDIPIVNSGFSDQEFFDSNPGEHLAIFDVQVERKSGKIFWYNIRENPGNPAVEEQAEHLLKHLQFQQCSDCFVASGEVEIAFRFKVKEP